MSVTIRAAGIRVTDRAVQIDLDGERHWLPKSQIDRINERNPFDVDGFVDDRLHEIVISDWIAQQKGFVLNEERYTVDESGVLENQPFTVKEHDRLVVCWCANQKDADKIAAALNLTIGKV